jgi:hypothetical protein
VMCTLRVLGFRVSPLPACTSRRLTPANQFLVSRRLCQGDVHVKIIRVLGFRVSPLFACTFRRLTYANQFLVSKRVYQGDVYKCNHMHHDAWPGDGLTRAAACPVFICRLGYVPK